MPGMLPTLMWWASNAAAVSNRSRRRSSDVGARRIARCRRRSRRGTRPGGSVSPASSKISLISASDRRLELVLDVGVPQAEALEADARRLGAAVAPLERAPFAADVDVCRTGNRPVQRQQLDLGHRHSSSLRGTEPEATAAPGQSSHPVLAFLPIGAAACRLRRYATRADDLVHRRRTNSSASATDPRPVSRCRSRAPDRSRGREHAALHRRRDRSGPSRS